MNPAEQFRDAIKAAGLTPPDRIEAGKFYKFPGDGKKRGNKAGWCKLTPDCKAGFFGDWSRGYFDSWKAESGRPLTIEEKEESRRSAAEAKAQAEAEREAQVKEARAKAAVIWDKARPAPDHHVYLLAKGVKVHGLLVHDGKLVVPMRDTASNLHSLQFIDGKGEKRFLTGGRVQGCYYGIGKPDGVLCITEGYATGASVHEATGHAGAVAFNAGNLLPVAKALRNKFPDIRLILCADDDAGTPGNPGITKATEAARAVGGLVAVPDFGENRPDGVTDFNDLAALRGEDAVRDAIKNAAAPHEDGTPGNVPAGDSARDDAEIARLAKLPLLKYERERTAAAERLGLRASILDKLVAAERPQSNAESGESVMFPEYEPWPDPVDGAALLDELAALASRFIVLPPHGDTALALWVAFTYFIEIANVAPILALMSPEKRCGKTTALSWLTKLSSRVLAASNITPSALFRAVEAWKPTLLIDEADSFLRDNEELRGVLNSGHTRSTAFVIRTVGDEHEPRRFTTWGAKAIALIGRLPDTLHDRSIVLEMRRKLPGERVEKLRYAEAQEFENLARRCIRFARDHAKAVSVARPSVPQGLSDRAADNWEPLLAIAEAAGVGWVERARDAALALSGAEQEAPSVNVELLADIARAFEDIDRLSSAELIKRLCADPERPWAMFAHGREMTQRQLAGRLRGFGVLSKSVRLPNGERLKGYELDQFREAFERYLRVQPADTGFQSVTAGQPNNGAGFRDFPKRDSDNVSRIEKRPKAAPVLDCHAVTDKNPVNGENAQEWEVNI